MSDILTDFFDDPKFCMSSAPDTLPLPENLFSIWETLKRTPCLPEIIMPCVIDQLQDPPNHVPVRLPENLSRSAVSCRTSDQASSLEDGDKPKGCKRRKTVANDVMEELRADGQRDSHMTVERNRRRQMNNHFSVLRSLMPSFYIKRGDQASIIGGVVEFITELQTLLQSLEAKKQRKVSSELLSPRSVSYARTMSSPRSTSLSHRLCLPISPRTPQRAASPYKPKSPLQPGQPRRVVEQLSFATSSSFSSPRELTNFENGVTDRLASANSNSAVADVEVKFSGRNLLLKTVSHRIPGQVLKITSALENLSLEILHVSIRTIDDTMYNTFTIKIEIECKLSAEELAEEIQQTFHSTY